MDENGLNDYTINMFILMLFEGDFFPYLIELRDTRTEVC